VFGLHSNADISYQINTAKSILDQILAVQPKESGTTSKGETREAVVAKIAEDMLRKLPRDVSFFVKAKLVWQMKKIRKFFLFDTGMRDTFVSGSVADQTILGWIRI
jgi:Dynein heavy chain C-terminal domain